MRKKLSDRLQVQPKNPSFTRYYQKNESVDDQSKPSVQEGRKVILRKIVVILGVLLMLVMLTRGVLITNYQLSLANNFDPYGQLTAYQSKLDELTSSPIFFFKPLLGNAKLEEDMKHAFNEIESVDFLGSWLSTKAELKANIAKPLFIVKNSNGAFLLDAQGMLINRLSELTKEAKQNLVTIEDQTGYNPNQGNQILSSAEVASIQQITDYLKSKGVGVESILLPPLPSELHVRTNQGHYIKFLLRGNTRLQLGAYMAIKQNIADGKVAPPTEYVDVRVEDKAFVK